MRTATLGIVASAAVFFAAPRHAQACGQGYGPGFAAAILTGMAVGAVDAGLFVWDSGSLLAGHQNSRGYAVFEAIWTVPQFAFGMYATVSELSRPYGNAAPMAVYTAAMAFMATHAIWTITRHDEEQLEASRRPSVGVGATYVPVGQLSAPGLGVVGRF